MLPCETIKQNRLCVFMKKEGCDFQDGVCFTVVEKCIGPEKKCENIEDFNGSLYCKIYAKPESKWLSGNCPMATNLKSSEEKEKFKNPLKKSKKSSRRK